MTLKFGLVGHKLSHSISPFIHGHLFKCRNIDAEYKIYDLAPQDFHKFDFYSLDGFNITIPYKKDIISKLQDIDADIKKYNSVNTVINNQKKLAGYNTDAYGFKFLLKKIQNNFHSVLIIGAGGVASTAATVLNDLGCKLTIATRAGSKEKAQAIVDNLTNPDIGIVDVDTVAVSEYYELIVNCTPVGMYPSINHTPINNINCGYLIDTIYNPQKTKLMEAAEEKGIPCIGGLDMLIAQAIEAQNIWFGCECKNLDYDILKQKCLEVLA